MTTGAKAAKASSSNAKDFPGLRAGSYREIGIPAVAAAVRCQRMAPPDDERASRGRESARADRGS